MRNEIRGRISPKLVNKLRIFIVMALIFLVLAVWHLVGDPDEWRWALLGIAMGGAIGVALTMFDQYAWNDDEDRVATSSNILAFIMLGIYIIFSITKDEILDDWITSPAALGMVTSWLSFGVMGMRVRRMRRCIAEVLKDQFRPAT